MNAQAGEFRQGWRVVLGAALGTGLGIAGLLNYNIGLFVEGMGRDFGLTRTSFGTAYFGSTLALAAALPLVGRMVERLGCRMTAALGSLALAAGFLLLAQINAVAAFMTVMVLIGLIGSASAPVSHTRAVAGQFRRRRGLALGLTQVGIGVAAAVIPPLIAMQVAAHGWRTGAMVLAALAAAGVVPALTCLPGRSPDANAGAAPGIAWSKAFLLQMTAFAAMAFAFAGMLPHFVPLLLEAGLPIARAGAIAGLIGIAVICSRIVIGWLSDRIEPAWLGAASCAICAAGCLVLALGGAATAPVAALALGAAMGAEADLIGILTARNFPLASYSRNYAAQYAAFIVAAGLGPMWVGALADATGSYRLPTMLCALALLVPIILFLRLPRHRGARQG